MAIVTGAGSGMGRATARLFAEEGAKVAGLDLNAEGLAETGGWHRTLDVTDEPAVQAAVAEVRAELGPIDILVNNAGVSLLTPIDSPD